MKKAFTLAEVLITLTIIGVIAALTIPNLSRKWRDHADVVKVKEAYSILSNAYRLCITENGTMENWDWGTNGNVTFPYRPSTSQDQNKLAECMLPYLKVEKYCGSASGCISVRQYLTLNGLTGDYAGILTHGKMRLQNGMSLIIQPGQITASGDAFWSTEGAIRVDINGDKGPNRMGYDVFVFGPIKNGIVAAACTAGYSYSGERNRSSMATHCSITNPSSSGRTCADWVLRKGNMDYKYRDVRAEW